MKATRKILTIGIIALTAAIGVGVFGGSGCQQQKQAGPPEKITIAYTINLNAALIHIAFAKNYFGEEGLEATPQPHAFGKPALQALIEGKADIASAADTPVMFALMDGKKINILAVIQTSNTNEAIVARRDRGIAKPSDLQGKTIGISAGTTVDFFADSLLNYYSIDRKNVQIIDLKPEQMAAALRTGKVDAVATWHPTLIQLQKQLGGRGIVFYGESIYTEMFCAIAAQEYVKKNPVAIKKVLRALLRAEKFVQQHPEQARHLVAEFIRMDKAFLDETWNDFSFRLLLDQALLMNMEDQTRWAIKNRLKVPRDMPNYLDFIYIDGLMAIKPEAVRIIR